MKGETSTSNFLGKFTNSFEKENLAEKGEETSQRYFRFDSEFHLHQRHN